ncbi:MAG: hypothetical protein ACNYPH_02315 [Gammaproteobacteria bacterium WSBS_2016_MAG_OTU1]
MVVILVATMAQKQGRRFAALSFSLLDSHLSHNLSCDLSRIV